MAGILVSLSCFPFGYNMCFSQGQPTRNATDISMPTSSSAHTEIDGLTETYEALPLVAGAFLGSLFANFPADRWGRRTTLLANNGVFVLGIVVCILAQSLGCFVIGRFITGLATGVSACVTPILLAEIAPPDQRGFMISMAQLQITVGIMVSWLVSYPLAMMDHGWKYHLGLSLVPSVLQVLLMHWVPESPRFLVRKKGDGAGSIEALRCVQRLRPAAYQAYVEEEVVAMVEEYRAELHIRSVWKELRTLKLEAAVGFGLMGAAAFTGINSYVLYARQLLEFAGSDDSGDLVALLIPLLNVVTTLVAMCVVDRIGRRIMVISGVGVMCGAMVANCAAYFIEPGQYCWCDTPGRVRSIIIIITLIVYFCAYAWGLGVCMWVVVTEILPTRLRTTALGLFLGFNWLINFAIANTLQVIGVLGGSGTQDYHPVDQKNARGAAILSGIYAIFCLFAWFLLRALLPETRGRTLVI